MIDLRSDTLTKPCGEMQEAIRGACIGDESYDENETVYSLEQFCTNYFKKEAAIFTPSGTMSNQIAIRCWTSPGDEIILDQSYHINYFEAGMTADLAKVHLNTCHNQDGLISESTLLQTIQNKHRSTLSSHPTLLCIENTINTLGGKIYPLDEMRESYHAAKKYNLNVHLDGARLMNACVASNTLASEYSRYTDSVAICFSKGLGAPFGSMLMGSKEFISQAKKYRKWYGGGLHQSGFMAAAALFAIQNNVSRLSQDHKNAKIFATILSSSPFIDIDRKSVETNIVMIDIKKINVSSWNFVESLEQDENVRLYPWSHNLIRAVTHLDLTSSQVAEAAYRVKSHIEKIYS